jgi:hypothetical protein
MMFWIGRKDRLTNTFYLFWIGHTHRSAPTNTINNMDDYTYFTTSEGSQ